MTDPPTFWQLIERWEQRAAGLAGAASRDAVALAEMRVLRGCIAELRTVEEWGEPPMPAPAQIRAWLAVNGWTESGSGPAGSMWTPDGETFVAVPHDDGDRMFTVGALARIARKEGRPAGELRREMMAVEVGEGGNGG